MFTLSSASHPRLFTPVLKSGTADHENHNRPSSSLKSLNKVKRKKRTRTTNKSTTTTATAASTISTTTSTTTTITTTDTDTTFKATTLLLPQVSTPEEEEGTNTTSNSNSIVLAKATATIRSPTPVRPVRPKRKKRGKRPTGRRRKVGVRAAVPTQTVPEYTGPMTTTINGQQRVIDQQSVTLADLDRLGKDFPRLRFYEALGQKKRYSRVVLLGDMIGAGHVLTLDERSKYGTAFTVEIS